MSTWWWWLLHLLLLKSLKENVPSDGNGTRIVFFKKISLKLSVFCGRIGKKDLDIFKVSMTKKVIQVRSLSRDTTSLIRLDL